MQVEEDPSSQFVDFTNATALEQFISDAEQTLIAWHLAGKGHASADALAAASSAATATATATDGPTYYTRVLEFEQPPRKPDGSMATTSAATQKVKYALTLFLARGAASEVETKGPNGDAATTGKKQWQQGREHFTPTMLAIADARRDAAVWSLGDHGDGDAWDAGGAHALSARAIAANAERWFGVDEFLLVTRTSLPSEREKRLVQQQQQQTLTRRLSRNALVKEEGTAAVDDAAQDATGVRHTGVTAGAAFDGNMDTNEANLVLSAIHLALLNCNCTIPAFVPIQHAGRGTWIGTAVPGSTGNVSITFETDSTPEANSNQSCISGLLDFFQLKLQLPPHIEDSCRLAGGGDAADLSVGTWVSAAFRYAWHRGEDPREEDKRPTDWRFEVLPDQFDASSSNIKQLSQLLFGTSASREHFWGAASNPIAGMELTAIWPSLKEGTYVDNAVHSTLDPQSAPQWMLDVQFDTKTGAWKRGLHDNSRKPTMPLSRVVANLVQAYSNAREISRDVLVSELAPTITSPLPSSTSTLSVGGSIPSPPTSLPGDAFSSSSRLPGTIPAARAAAVFGNAIGSITSTIVSAATWKGADIEEIQRIVAEIFDNLDDERANLTSTWSVPPVIAHSAPVGELVSVLACRMGQLHGLSAMSLLWVEFVKSLRERWFQQRLLPLLSTRENPADDKYDESTSHTLDALFLLDSTSVNLPHPDFRQCLLHQKLQLLNTCILHQAEGVKSDPENVEPSSLRRSLSTSSTLRAGTRMSDLTAFAFDEDDDDEFFDSVEVHDSVASNRSPVLSSIGVRRPLPSMTSLLTGQPLMEPLTQVAVPLTEDVAKQQQELLSRLGVGPESTVLRQQLQSAALVSDMQAFKAANPGSCLADFIRWYSPKDWISADPLSMSTYATLPLDGENVWWFKEKGMLSERMRSSSGNRASSLHVWHQMWETSTPVPVSKQKRLFDPVGESEKLYHYLETIAPHEMFHQMLVSAISSCYSMLERACLPPHIRISTINDALQDLRKQCDRAVSLLDEAYAESQVAFPTGRDQKGEQEKAKSQLQVAFEMALDACRTTTRSFEQVEQMVSQASALLRYFSDGTKEQSKPHEQTVQLVDSLLSIAHQRVPRDEVCSTRSFVSKLLEAQSLRSRIGSLVLHNPAYREPIHREYVIRCICPRPFLDDYLEPEHDEDESVPTAKLAHGADQDESAILDLLEDSPVVVNRMYACFTKETVRFALTLAESEF